MTPRAPKPWTKTIDESGVAIRVYERESGSLLYREVRLDGRKDRKSLGHRDRALAEQQAHELARRLAELRLTGHTGAVTFGQLTRLYQQHRLAVLAEDRADRARECIRIFTAFLGDRFLAADFSQSHVDRFAAARRTGELGDPRRKPDARGVRDGTVRSDLVWLASLFNFGCGYRVNGRPLLSANPMRGLSLPRERNVRRPVASEDRYRRTLAKCDVADRSGRLACVLALARYTGRRISAICQLRASDVLLSPEAVTRALAALGQDPTLARHMPHGAVRWRAGARQAGLRGRRAHLEPGARGARALPARAAAARRRLALPAAPAPGAADDAAGCPAAPGRGRAARGAPGGRARRVPQLPPTLRRRAEASARRRRHARRRVARPGDDEAQLPAAGPGDYPARHRKRAGIGVARTHFGHTPEGKRRPVNGLGDSLRFRHDDEDLHQDG